MSKKNAVIAIILASSLGLLGFHAGLFYPRRDNTQQRFLQSSTAMHLLKGTVRISNDGSTGSGVVVYSGRRNSTVDPRYYTYILTCAHVVDDAKTVTVEAFHYFDDSGITATSKYSGRIIAKDADKDLAVVEITSTKAFENIIELVPPRNFYDRTLYEPAFVVGCGLGKPPYITNGNVSSFESDDSQLQISSATIFGNSGGGVYTADGRLLGIVRAISLAQHHFPVSHLAFAVPVWNVSLFLVDNHLGFILRIPGTSLNQSLMDRAQAESSAEVTKHRQELEEAEKQFRHDLLKILEGIKDKDNVAPIVSLTIAPIISPSVSPITSPTQPNSPMRVWR